MKNAILKVSQSVDKTSRKTADYLIFPLLMNDFSLSF